MSKGPQSWGALLLLYDRRSAHSGGYLHKYIALKLLDSSVRNQMVIRFRPGMHLLISLNHGKESITVRHVKQSK